MLTVQDVRDDFLGMMENYQEARRERLEGKRPATRIPSDTVYIRRCQWALAFAEQVSAWPIAEEAKVDLISEAYLRLCRLITLGTVLDFTPPAA